MHLLSFRKGWESERLAEYLLSRVAFVASPTTVADDLGTDFFCTLFEDIAVGGKTFLQPRLSVAVQVKSSGKQAFDLSDKVDYLTRVELPYLLAVADRTAQTLSVYSGCYLPVLFAKHGATPTLTAILDETGNGGFPPPDVDMLPTAVPFPLLTVLKPTDTDAALTVQRKRIILHCSQVAGHVRGRLSSDYFFPFDHSEIVFAGPSSATTFRHRLLGRCAEALHNLHWLDTQGSPAPATERQAIEALVRELGLRHPLPMLLDGYKP